MTVLDRFLAKVDQSGDCWTWTASAGKYGFFFLNGKQVSAHVAAYELFVGTLPTGLEIDHTCRNTLCVRPDHLEAVTHAENMRRADVVLGIRSAVTRCPSGHPYDATNTYRYGGNRQCRICRVERTREFRARKKALV